MILYKYKCYHCGSISNSDKKCARCGSNVFNFTLDNIRRKRIKNIEYRIHCYQDQLVLLEKERLRLINGT